MTKEEMLDALCQFKVTDMVAMKAHVMIRKQKKKNLFSEVQPLQVLERHVMQCHGGVQVYYVCRAHMTSRFDSMAFGTEFLRIAEPEVEAYVLEPEPEEKAA